MVTIFFTFLNRKYYKEYNKKYAVLVKRLSWEVVRRINYSSFKKKKNNKQTVLYFGGFKLKALTLY